MDEQGVYDLLRGRLKFADITSFNDPFEARPAYVPAFTDAGMQRTAMLRYLAQICPHDLTPTKKRVWAQDVVRGRSMDELVKLAEERDRSGQYFVLCLMAVETVLTPLPWSHYADSHRGVCVHFDAALAPLNLAFPVQYSDEYPELVVPRTHRDSWEQMRNVVLRKSSHWSYEHEYRVIKVNLPEAALARDLRVTWQDEVAIASEQIAKRITLGCKMPSGVKERLIAWVRTNAPHVEVWQANLHRSRYQFTLDRVN